MSDPVLDAALARAMARLRDPASPHLERGVEVALESALARPLREVIDPDRAVALALGAIDAERIERVLHDIVHPAIDRQRDGAAARGDTVAQWVPDDGPALLDEIVAGARRPRGAWASAIVDPAHVRELLAPVLQETLLAFARKLPGVGGAESNQAGKLLGGLARGLAQGAGAQAQKLADLGRGVLGGLGAEMEKRIGTAAKDFSQNAFEPLRETFVQRLESDEGKAILGTMRAHAVRTLLEAPAAQLIEDLDAAPRASVDRLIARSIAHVAGREETRALMRAEVETFLAAREGRTVRDLLDELGVTGPAIAEARIALTTVARAAAQGDALEGWLRELLAE